MLMMQVLRQGYREGRIRYKRAVSPNAYFPLCVMVVMMMMMMVMMIMMMMMMIMMMMLVFITLSLY